MSAEASSRAAPATPAQAGAAPPRGLDRAPRAAALLARRLRRHAARGGALGAARRRHDPLAPERRPRAGAARPGAAHRRGASSTRSTSGAVRRALVAPSHGRLATAVAGEAHALLARPLRHHRSGHADDARAEQDAAPPRARLVPGAPAGDWRARPGDAPAPVAGQLGPRRAERELRPRADGAVHARRGYSERDIREASRKVTGFRADWNDDGSVRTYYDREYHDRGRKRIFGKRGRFDWATCSRSACAIRRTRRSSSRSSGSSSFPRRRRPRCVADSRRTYRRSGHRIKPVVGAILAHLALYRRLDEPTMVKAPVVFLAGALRGSARASSATPGAGSCRAWASSSSGRPR